MFNFEYQSKPRIDQRKSILERFSSQSLCDITFVCKDDDDNWIKIGAHKFYLSVVSEVFDTMFYGESVKNGAVTDNPEIKIEDIGFEAFKLFLGFIYNAKVEFDHGSRLAEFYYAAHKYNCDKALWFATHLMFKKLCPKNVSIFHHVAVLHNIPNLKKECEKTITSQTDKVLRSSEFLKATPETVNFIFRLNESAVHSEIDFVWALERYTNFNKDHPEIPKEVRPALQAIRFLTLGVNDIATTSLLTTEEKKAIISCLSSNDDTKMPKSFTLEKTKRERKNLESPEIKMIIAMRDIFVSDKCFYCFQHKIAKFDLPFWKCKNHYSSPGIISLTKIYESYSHTDLLLYKMDDIRHAYQICLLYGYLHQKFCVFDA